jgi:hypothetical protein
MNFPRYDRNLKTFLGRIYGQGQLETVVNLNLLHHQQN